MTLRNSIAPARRRQHGASRSAALGRRVEDVAEPLDRDLHLLEVLPELGQAQDRLRRPAPAIMLKATSAPTVSSPSITALAPNSSSSAVVSLADVLDRVLAD